MSYYYGSYGASCAGSFEDPQDQVTLARLVIFLAVYFGVFIALWTVRGKSATAKKLLGIPFIFSIILLLM